MDIADSPDDDGAPGLLDALELFGEVHLGHGTRSDRRHRRASSRRIRFVALSNTPIMT